MKGQPLYTSVVWVASAENLGLRMLCLRVLTMRSEESVLLQLLTCPDG